MIITSQNRDTAIRNNISSTLAQIKVGGKTNVALIIQAADTSDDVDLGLTNIDIAELADLTVNQLEELPLLATPAITIAFYTDVARTSLAFSDDSDTNPSHFSIAGDGRTRYTPPDSLINNAMGISTTLCQGIYYVTATFNDGKTVLLTYRNIDNLLFQQVLIASKADPAFAPNDNAVVCVPLGQELQDRGTNDDRSYLILTFEVYIHLLVFNWDKLTEAERLTQKEIAGNTIRNALYADRYRGGNCTCRSPNQNGTYIGKIDLLPSKGQLKAKVQIQTVSNVASTGF